jgi:hypothetical protein
MEMKPWTRMNELQRTLETAGEEMMLTLPMLDPTDMP